MSVFARSLPRAASIVRSSMCCSRTAIPQCGLRALSSEAGAGSDDYKNIARHVCELDNDTLVLLAVEGDPDACKERLVREIMAVDEVSWDDAQPRIKEISAANNEGMGLTTMPYKVGIVGAVTAGLATFPLCFDLNTALVFNDLYVTTDVADDKDLETWLEVGSWTWNWMEPPLGQLSFFLLCLQFSRAQMEKLGRKPFTRWLVQRRASALSKRFPQYHAQIMEDFSMARGLRAST